MTESSTVGPLLETRNIMTSKLKRNAVRNHSAVISFLMGAETLLVFVIGLGRYRTVLLLGLFFFLKGAFTKRKTALKITSILLAPSFALSLYLDVKSGQIFPIFPGLSFLITIASLVVTDALLIRGYVYKALQKWSGYVLFKVCPRCKYDNRTLVDQCPHCSYKTILAEEDSSLRQLTDTSEIDTALANEITEYRKAGLKQPTKKILFLLGLHKNELVLISLKLFPFRSYYKNGERSIASNMVLTTERIIFIHSVFFERGWRMREDVSYNDVTEVLTTTKQVVTASEPVTSVKTRDSHYEVCFKKLFPYREKIDCIISCIKKRSPSVRVTSDVAYTNL